MCPKDVLSSLTSFVISKPEDVALVIQWRYCGNDKHLQQRWKAWFLEWLTGTGHIEHPHLDGLITTEEREARKEDRLFRAINFVRYMTTLSGVLPHGGITVRCQ